MGRLLVIGSLNMDQVVRVPHIPVPGETILGDSLHYVGGGKGANQAYTLGRLGASVAMLGSVGRDEHGDKLLENLSSVGVEVEAVQRLEEVPSGLAIIGVEDSGNNNIIVVPGANLHTSPDYIQSRREMIGEAQAVIMQLEIPIESVAQAAALAREMKKLVILDPAPATRLPDDLYRNIDILKPNEIELAHLADMPVTNIDEAEKAARKILERGVGTVVVTLGSEGALIVTGASSVYMPVSSAVAAVDTTAAGDSFTAAMTMMLVEGYSLEQAVEFAGQVAGIVVSRPGAQSSIPSADEVAAIKPPLA
ncbi:ribokinase [Deltaproteobacteria bacterium Smac51]|nr:ribokinase [Deltaproteobacteria bacterium Smac51]